MTEIQTAIHVHVLKGCKNEQISTIFSVYINIMIANGAIYDNLTSKLTGFFCNSGTF